MSPIALMMIIALSVIAMTRAVVVVMIITAGVVAMTSTLVVVVMIITVGVVPMTSTLGVVVMIITVDRLRNGYSRRVRGGFHWWLSSHLADSCALSKTARGGWLVAKVRGMRVLLRYLAQGVLIAVPIAVTIYVVYSLVRAVDGLLPLPVPGLGLVVTIALLTLLGFVASSVVGTRLVALAEGLLRRVPLVKILFGAVKDLVGAFVGDRKGFDHPVVVQLPGGHGRVFGFATRDSVPIAGLGDHVAVYFPQSYNFAGNLVAVPRADVTPLDVASSELMSFVISGGIAGLTPREDGRAPRPNEANIAAAGKTG